MLLRGVPVGARQHQRQLHAGVIPRIPVRRRARPPIEEDARSSLEHARQCDPSSVSLLVRPSVAARASASSGQHADQASIQASSADGGSTATIAVADAAADADVDADETDADREAAAGERAQDDEVLSLVLGAARAAGRQPGEAERALAQRLRDNWYTSARDVAALSPQDLAALGAPLRVRAAAAAAVEEADAAADRLSGAAETAPRSAAAAPATVGEEPLDPDIMKRRAPPRRRAFKRGSVRVTRKAPGASWVGGGGGGEGGDTGDGRGDGASLSSSPSSSLPPAPPRSPSRHAYGLLEREMHPDLAAELAALERFCTERTLGRRRAPVARATHQGTVRYLRLMLGWLARVRGVGGKPGAAAAGSSSPSPASLPSTVTSLRQLFPSREREGAALLFEFRDFLERERGANARTVFNAMMSAAHAVRFLWGGGGDGAGQHAGGEAGASAAAAGPAAGAGAAAAAGAAPDDPPVLLEVRAMAGAAFKQTRRCPLVSDESKKWLTWPEYAGLVSDLRRECAGLTPSGEIRSPREVASSLQRYLIFAILACVPDRQRTLRELRVGHTLVKEPLLAAQQPSGAVGSGDGDPAAAAPPYRWIVRHGAGDYKTGRLYGARPPLVLAPPLYPELEAYVDEWRRHLAPAHDFLFTTVSASGGGRPLTASCLYKLFSHTALVRTGRPMNPHLTRDLVVTHLRAQGTGEPEMEALAVYMGHSVRQQRETYDRRTRAQRAAPAVELMSRLAAGAAAAGAGATAAASLPLGGGGADARVRAMFGGVGPAAI